MNVETAQRLADLRRSKGFSQEGLARKLGLSRQAVSQDFSLLAAQRPASTHPLCGWRQTALQSHPSDRY